MPSNCSAKNSSGKARTQHLLLRTFTAHWPVEKVVVELEVVVPRELVPLEWVLERMLEEFDDGVPTLAEAAHQLCTGTAAMLQATLQGLIDLGAVELKNADQPIDLPNCRLSDSGRVLLAEGSVGGAPERHGLELHFDALTGCHLPALPNRPVTKPENPLVAEEQLPHRRSGIGLDIVRDLARAQDEPYQSEDSRIQSAAVRHENGCYVWQPVTLELRADEAGVVHIDLSAGTDDRRDWFKAQDGDLLTRLTGALHQGNGKAPSPIPFQDWDADVERIVEPDTVAEEVRQLLQSARGEVIASAAWLKKLGLVTELPKAARRGVQVCLRGADPSISHWTSRTTPTPGFLAYGVPDPTGLCAIVSDRSRGLQLTPVALRTAAGQEVVLDLVAEVVSTQVKAIHMELLEGLADSLADGDRRRCFAAFAISGEVVHWKHGARLLAEEVEGEERSRQLQQWLEWGQRIVPGVGFDADLTELVSRPESDDAANEQIRACIEK